MLSRLILLVTIAILALTISCTETPTNPPVRDNPLDENNPETGGDPFELTVQISGGGIQLNWQTVGIDGVDGYNVHRSVDDGSFSLYHEVSGRTTSSYTDTDLENGCQYTYYIVTRNTQGQESTSNTAHIEINNTPYLSIDEGDYTPSRTVNLSLLAFGAEKMQIGTLDLSSAQWVDFVASTTIELEIDVGIKTVQAQFAYADGDTSAVVSDNTQPQPMNPSFNINNDAPETEFTAVTLHLSAQGSNLQYIASENSGFSGANWQNYTAQPNFTLSPGVESKTIYVKYKNDFEIESSALSDAISYVYCIAPTSLSAQVDELSITLNWEDNSSFEDGYKIERKETGGSYSEIGTVGQNVETYVDSGLTAGTTYYYRVLAYNSQGSSSYSNEADGTAEMSAPTNLFLSLASLSQLDLSWDDNSNVEEGYKIERKVGASGAYTQIAVLGSNVESYSDTGLQENQTYYYRVRAYNGTNNSSYSNEADGTTTYLGGYEQTFDLGTTGETIQMVWIPSGSFMQGRYSGEQGSSSNEDPPHLVTLDYGFWLGKYELTQSQWEAVTGSNPSHNYGVGDNYPVYYVSWNMITNDFLPTLNGQTTTGEWRLPSESEWEYSCRAGTETRFYWGDDLSETEIDDYAVYSGNDPGGTAEVGSKLPNAWNLYDMSGNVWEWVEDYWHSDYTGSPTNGDPWLSPTSSYRVLRGGSWGYFANYCRSASRNYYNPSNTYYYFGFRIVFSP